MWSFGHPGEPFENRVFLVRYLDFAEPALPYKPGYTNIKRKKAIPKMGIAFLLTAYGSDDYMVIAQPLFQFAKRRYEVDKLVGITPLVVVPGNYLHELVAQGDTCLGIED